MVCSESALTPALSPRRGRRAGSVFGKICKFVRIDQVDSEGLLKLPGIGSVGGGPEAKFAFLFMRAADQFRDARAIGVGNFAFAIPVREFCPDVAHQRNERQWWIVIEVVGAAIDGSDTRVFA